jgi:hypothetical protein
MPALVAGTRDGVAGGLVARRDPPDIGTLVLVQRRISVSTFALNLLQDSALGDAGGYRAVTSSGYGSISRTFIRNEEAIDHQANDRCRAGRAVWRTRERAWSIRGTGKAQRNPGAATRNHAPAWVEEKNICWIGDLETCLARTGTEPPLVHYQLCPPEGEYGPRHCFLHRI